MLAADFKRVPNEMKNTFKVDWMWSRNSQDTQIVVDLKHRNVICCNIRNTESCSDVLIALLSVDNDHYLIFT